MDVFLARQPIFDKNLQVYAYELLYREDETNAYSSINADQASSNVMLNSFDLIGIENLTGGKKAFVNFTSELIKQGVATLFPKEILAIEILETVKPDDEIIASCKELKKSGYMIVLDDFVFQKEYGPLIALADIIKIDFVASGDKEREIIKHLANGRVKFLAEKIETLEDFEQAKQLGYTYFQGYFFSKPLILSVRDLQPLRFNYLKLIDQANGSEIDFEKITDIIAKDVSLSYKLLKLVNSAAFGFRNKIVSVRHALVILGTREIRKWISLIALKGMGDGQPDEIIQLSLVRAKFCEMIAGSFSFGDQSEELFLLGLFSALDVLMHRPMEEVLQDISISEEVREALLKKEGKFGDIYKMILAYEKGDWDRVLQFKDKMHLERKDISKAYMEAVTWSIRLELEVSRA